MSIFGKFWPTQFHVFFNVPFNSKDDFKADFGKSARWNKELKKWYIIYGFDENYIDLDENTFKKIINSRPNAFNYEFSHVSWNYVGCNEDKLNKIIKNILTNKELKESAATNSLEKKREQENDEFYDF